MITSLLTHAPSVLDLPVLADPADLPQPSRVLSLVYVVSATGRVTRRRRFNDMDELARPLTAPVPLVAMPGRRGVAAAAWDHLRAVLDALTARTATTDDVIAAWSHYHEAVAA
jgi:hypothetical protein